MLLAYFAWEHSIINSITIIDDVKGLAVNVTKKLKEGGDVEELIELRLLNKTNHSTILISGHRGC